MSVKSNENFEDSINKNWQIQSRKHSDLYEVYELEIEKHLKILLEKIITFLEKFIASQSEVEFIEQKLHDYENMPELIKINMEVFAYLENKILEKIKGYKGRLKKKEVLQQQQQQQQEGEQLKQITDESQSISTHINNNNGSFCNNIEYEKLEKQIQKYESEIRNHIRVEQQLKLYAESLSEKSTNNEKEKTLMELTKNNEIQELKKQIEEIKSDNKKKQNELNEVKQQLQEQKEMLINLNNITIQNQKQTPNRLSTSNIFDMQQQEKNSYQILSSQNKTFFQKKTKPQATNLLQNYDNFIKKKNSKRTIGNLSQRDGQFNQFPLTKQTQFMNENSQDSKIITQFPSNKIINILANSKVNTRQQYLLNPSQEKQQLVQVQQSMIKSNKYLQTKDQRSKSYNTIYNNKQELNSFTNNYNNFSQIYRVHSFQKQHSQPKKL